MTYVDPRDAHRWARIACVALAVGACDSPTEPTGPDTTVVDEYRASGIVLSASARAVSREVIEVTLIAMNETDFDAQLGILGGNCMFRPRVYTRRGGALVWSAFDLFDACQEPLRLIQLGGGDEERIERSFDVDAPARDYFVTLTIVHTDLVELAAGSISLR